MQNSDLSTWIQFFKDASIPTQFVQLYANKFIEHRIRFDMLSDLDKSLLNEMGITAIGDCLCILKHAKLIVNQIDEKNKTEISNDSQSVLGVGASNSANTNQNTKKRSDVAKRIIETYLSDPDAKPLTEKQTSTGLSADLISRLNFNPTKITFNTDDTHNQQQTNTSPKVIVSSTTSDDELRNKLTRNTTKRKQDDEITTDNFKITKTIKLKDTTIKTGGSVLEYRGLLKNEPDTVKNEVSKVISLKPKRAQTASVPLTLNERIRLNQEKKLSNFKFENFKIETKSADLISAHILKNLGSLKSDSMTSNSIKKVDSTTTTTNKPKIVPITFDIKPSSSTTNDQTTSNKNSQSLKKPSTTTKSIFDRITF